MSETLGDLVEPATEQARKRSDLLSLNTTEIFSSSSSAWSRVLMVVWSVLVVLSAAGRAEGPEEQRTEGGRFQGKKRGGLWYKV